MNTQWGQTGDKVAPLLCGDETCTGANLSPVRIHSVAKMSFLMKRHNMAPICHQFVSSLAKKTKNRSGMSSSCRYMRYDKESHFTRRKPSRCP
jgi:hypothetical protein